MTSNLESHFSADTGGACTDLLISNMAQYTTFILVTVLMVTAGSWAQIPPPPVAFIPTLYVTGATENPASKQAFVYQANICNTTLYENMMVITRVNIPLGWNLITGVLAKIKVCASADCSTVLCTNYPAGKFNGQHNCTFPYNTTMRSLYISVTAGNAPYIAWTVSMEFLPTDQYVEKRNRNQLYYKIFEFPEPIAINSVTDADVKVLQQVVPPGSAYSVTTSNKQDFRLAFCPDSGTTPRYNLDIIVTALDSISAMATYACEPPIDPTVGCLPDDAVQSDARGIAINVVTLTSDSGAPRDVYLAVVGWGDGEQTNKFSIGAVIKSY